MNFDFQNIFAVFFVALIGIKTLFVSAYSYNEATLYRLAQASSLSYLSKEKIASSPYYKSSQLEAISQMVDPQSESGATIFMDKNDTKRLIVACRGSANPKNFGTNLKFKLVPATRLSQDNIPENAMVHEGFQDASVGLWRQLGPRLIEILQENSSISDLVFTGHSLGAATALLCSVHYNAATKTSLPGKLPTVITFGGPKLCNGILARYIRNEALEGSNVLHLVHDKDPVLANNQKLWDSLGFENVGIELQCDPKSPTVFCDDDDDNESSKKSSLFGNFAWNIIDHCNYMGVFVGPRMVG